MRLRFLGAFCAVAVLLAGPARGAGEGTLEGRVVAGGAGLDGVTVELYLEQKKSAGGTPFAVTESREGGRFALALPPGSYYLWAKGRPPAFGPPLVTEYPANPVVVAAGRTTTVPALELKEIGRESAPPAPKETGLKGRVTADGKASAGAAVMIYAAAAARLTGPGYVASVVTGTDGSFQADLPPGRYRVAARKRRDGAAAGFLRYGDSSVEFAGNPVAVAQGRYTDLGDLQLHGVDAQRLAEREKGRREGTAPTRLAGSVTGPGGSPLAGQYVFVYRDQGMIGRPAQMTISGRDGSFTFDLPDGGTWHLGARSTMGGPRQPGEMAGRLSGSPDSSVTVKQGTTRGGLIITMEVTW